jgi:hypothetical protein
MSKILVGFAIAASAIIAPALSFAQTNGPVSQSSAQSAAATSTAQSDQKLAMEAVGGTTSNGGTASGNRAHKPMSTCVGPVSYCDIFFGS